jgi:predicted transcriptional regulator
VSNEPDVTTIQDRYAQQIVTDLAANRERQEQVRSQATELQQTLEQLACEEQWLVSAQEKLEVRPPAAPAAEPSDAVAAQSTPEQPSATSAVPQPRSSAKAAASKTPNGTGGKKAAKKEKAAAGKPARTASTPDQPKAAAAGGGPSLRDMVLGMLAQHHEPRQVSEVVSELASAHPERPASPQVVRGTLEALVAKGELERERQKRSVFYTAPATDTASTTDTGSETTSQASPESDAEVLANA